MPKLPNPTRPGSAISARVLSTCNDAWSVPCVSIQLTVVEPLPFSKFVSVVEPLPSLSSSDDVNVTYVNGAPVPAPTSCRRSVNGSSPPWATGSNHSPRGWRAMASSAPSHAAGCTRRARLCHDGARYGAQARAGGQRERRRLRSLRTCCARCDRLVAACRCELVLRHCY